MSDSNDNYKLKTVNALKTDVPQYLSKSNKKA